MITSDLPIGDITYTFHTEIGWKAQASYDATAHMIVQIPSERLERSQRSFSRISMEGTITALPNPVDQRDAKLKAWLIRWTGKPEPKDKDYDNIPTRHMIAIEEFIDGLEAAMEAQEIDAPLEKPFTDL